MGDKNFLRAFVQRGAAEGQAGDPIRFTASTEGIKRDGMDLRAEDWYLDNFRKNPVFLWAHDYFGQKLPLGRVEAIVQDRVLLADVVFDQDDEFARAVENKYRKGFLHTVSVGWNFIEQDKRRLMDLLDVSGVPVPGDPDALVMRQYEALNEIVNDNKPSPEKNDGEDEWSDVAAAMVAVFDPASDDPDDVRERCYKALLPKYRRLGKVAPEFINLEDLRALGVEEIAGLFLEEEIQAQININEHRNGSGEIFVSRALKELEKAAALIQYVLERAAKPETEASDIEDQPVVSTSDLTLLAMANKLNMDLRSLK